MHGASYKQISDAVVSPTTLTGLKCTIPHGCQIHAAWNLVKTVVFIPQGPGGKLEIMASGEPVSSRNFWIVHSIGSDSWTDICNDHVLSGCQGRHLLCINIIIRVHQPPLHKTNERALHPVVIFFLCKINCIILYGKIVDPPSFVTPLKMVSSWNSRLALTK
ncbi:hypothetical protein E2320_020762 [Naja naja]|nr:hypothetical protein E2320_020762 [Naja naja]